MKMPLRVPVVVMLVALLLPASASAQASWNKVQSTNFVVVGDVSYGRLESVARTIERFRLATSQIFPARAVSGARPLTVVVVSRETMVSFVGSEFIAGVYRSGGNHDYIVMNSDLPAEVTMEVALHEYQHLINHATWASLPRWVDEGLAEFYSTFRDLDGGKRYHIGLPIRDHVRTLNEWGRTRVLDFIADDGRNFAGINGVFRIEDFYAQSWALVHFFALGDRGRWSASLPLLVEALAKGEDGTAAFRRIVSADVEEFETGFRRHLQGQTFGYVSVVNETAEQIPVQRGRLTVAETQTLRGSLLADRETAGAAIAAARAADPSYRPAVALDARHRLISRASGAEEALTAYVKETPDDLFTCGFAMFALNAAGRFEQALAACPAAAGPAANTFERVVALEGLGRAAETGPLRARLALAPEREIRDLNWRAWRYLEEGRYAAARRAADTAAGKDVNGPDSVAYLRFVSTLAQFLDSDVDRGRAELRRISIPAGSLPWVKNVSEYLLGNLDAAMLLSRAKSREEQTEARAYIGLTLLATGNTAAAAEHLKWIADRGSKLVTEYYVALAHYQRLSGSPAVGLR